MIIQKLGENQVQEIKQEIKKKQIGLNKLHINYRFVKGELYIDALGVEGIPQTEEYYESIEDNLTYIDFAWLTPLSNHLNVNLDASIPVSPDGSFEHNNINLELHIAIPGEVKENHRILSYVTPLFKKLIPFRAFLTQIEFGWHNYRLSNIRFKLSLDGKKVNSILKTEQVVNTQILGQWLSALSQVLDYNQGRYKHLVDLPIINGRISTAKYETGLCFRFDGKGKKKWS